MDFIPQPQCVQYKTGVFVLGYQTKLVMQNAPAASSLYLSMLQEEILQSTGLVLSFLRGQAQTGDVLLRCDDALPCERYHLQVCERGVTLCGGSEQALCNGVQTLRQLIRRHGAILPCIDIVDYPDFANRGYYLDVSRGRVPTLKALKEYADLLCFYKINQWQLYIEHTYLFRELSEVWRDDTPLTAQEIMELDAYCRARHIELVPSLSSFGHMYKILHTKSCAEFCELDEQEPKAFTYTYAGKHHTLNVSNDKTLPFIKNLISEYMQLFSSRKFNLCADETYDLGKGKSLALAQQKGEQALYMEHVKALCEFLIEQGRTPMFWGDIVWRFPEAVQELPKETICLNWGYVPHQREDEMRMLAEAGATQYACPGVCAWKQWVPLIRNAYDNITTMCAHARKFKAVGILNTDWGDYGHINHPWLAVPGIVYGAAFSWNGEAVPFEEINRAISALQYQDSSEKLVEAIVQMSGNEVFDWLHTVQWIEAAEQERKTIFAQVDCAQIVPANANIDAALQRVHQAAKHMGAAQRNIVQALGVVADGVKIWNSIGRYIFVHYYKNDGTAESGAALAVRLENWYYAYLTLWRTCSKESSVHELTRLIGHYADFLRTDELIDDQNGR